jgi:hypothetical protein
MGVKTCSLPGCRRPWGLFRGLGNLTLFGNKNDVVGDSSAKKKRPKDPKVGFCTDLHERAFWQAADLNDEATDNHPQRAHAVCVRLTEDIEGETTEEFDWSVLIDQSRREANDGEDDGAVLWVAARWAEKRAAEDGICRPVAVYFATTSRIRDTPEKQETHHVANPPLLKDKPLLASKEEEGKTDGGGGSERLTEPVELVGILGGAFRATILSVDEREMVLVATAIPDPAPHVKSASKS